jgi:DHA1 family tetracycline resistance protein-like MFS transporter
MSDGPEVAAPPDEGAAVAVPARPKPGRGALWVVYATVFLDLLGFGIILPWLPYYAAELGATGLGLGVLFTAYSFAQLIGAAVLGRLSDRHGRRPILLLSLAGSTVGMVLCGVAGTLLFLCLARAVAGLFGGSVTTAQAYVADVTSREERAKYMGFIGASIGLGFVLGPALGAAFIALGQGFSEVAFFAAGLLAVNLLIGLWRLPETRPAGGAETASRASSRFDPAAWVAALRQPGLASVLTARGLTMFGFVGMETTFAFLGRDLFGLDNLRFGLVLTYVGVVMIVVQGALIGRLSSRFGVRRVAVVGGLLMGVSLAALPLSPALPPALVVLGLLATSQGLTVPTLSTLTSHLAAEDVQGSVLGVGQSLSAAARAFGPLVAGALYDVDVGLPYFTGGVLAFVAGLLVWRGRGAEER